MATTSQLLTWIELECHGWQREGRRGSRALLNEAHRILNYGQHEQNIIWDETIGDLPYFTTQNNVFHYNCPDNVWLVTDILIDDGTDLDSTSTRTWKLERTEVSGNRYYGVKNIRTRPRTRNNNAQILFMGLNPGATTALFRRLAYREPTDITSDTVQHDMPADTDMRYLVPATMALIDAINDHSKMLNARMYIEKELKPNYLMELDYGEQGVSGYCVKRAF